MSRSEDPKSKTGEVCDSCGHYHKRPGGEKQLNLWGTNATAHEGCPSLVKGAVDSPGLLKEHIAEFCNMSGRTRREYWCFSCCEPVDNCNCKNPYVTAFVVHTDEEVIVKKKLEAAYEALEKYAENQLWLSEDMGFYCGKLPVPKIEGESKEYVRLPTKNGGSIICPACGKFLTDMFDSDGNQIKHRCLDTAGIDLPSGQQGLTKRFWNSHPFDRKPTRMACFVCCRPITVADCEQFYGRKYIDNNDVCQCRFDYNSKPDVECERSISYHQSYSDSWLSVFYRIAHTITYGSHNSGDFRPGIGVRFKLQPDELADLASTIVLALLNQDYPPDIRWATESDKAIPYMISGRESKSIKEITGVNIKPVHSYWCLVHCDNGNNCDCSHKYKKWYLQSKEAYKAIGINLEPYLHGISKHIATDWFKTCGTLKEISDSQLSISLAAGDLVRSTNQSFRAQLETATLDDVMEISRSVRTQSLASAKEAVSEKKKYAGNRLKRLSVKKAGAWLTPIEVIGSSAQNNQALHAAIKIELEKLPTFKQLELSLYADGNTIREICIKRFGAFDSGYKSRVERSIKRTLLMLRKSLS